MRRFENRIALVTGAASGIGRETACRLAAEGASVLCTDVNESGAPTVAEEIVGRGHRASALALDVADEHAWENAAGLLPDGRLDVLVHCAGISDASPIPETTFDRWRRVLSVNLDGAFLATRFAIRAMRVGGGSIVHVSSASGIRPSPGTAAYSVSKAALCMLGRAAAKECREHGLPIRVNTVCPGGVKTPMWHTMPFFRDLVEKTGSEEAAFETMAGGNPAARFADPADVVHAILFLASDDGRFITGADLPVDGGYVL